MDRPALEAQLQIVEEALKKAADLPCKDSEQFVNYVWIHLARAEADIKSEIDDLVGGKHDEQ